MHARIPHAPAPSWSCGSVPIHAPWPLLAALAATALDLGVAVLFWTGEGIDPLRPVQHIASWWLGPAAFAGGLATAVLGVGLYALLMWGLARGYLAAARRVPGLVRRHVAGGLVYGAAMYGVVFHVAVPLFAVDGAAPTRPDWIVVCLLAYMVLIGLPCAWAAKRVLAR